MNEYPTDAELRKIKNWNYRDTDGLLEFLEQIWWTPEWGFKLKGNRLELHTGGWSGNEEIIGVLQNTLFWFLYWQKSVRGGHYYFKIYKPRKVKR